MVPRSCVGGRSLAVVSILLAVLGEALPCRSGSWGALTARDDAHVGLPVVIEKVVEEGEEVE